MYEVARFVCENFRPVYAMSIEEAAGVFANRMARREYGRRGYARTLTSNGYKADGSGATFEAFIGKDVPGTTQIRGHNVWVYVDRG